MRAQCYYSLKLRVKELYSCFVFNHKLFNHIAISERISFTKKRITKDCFFLKHKCNQIEA